MAARRAILKATHELLQEGGLSSVTIEGIAARAGVGKPTIYRTWPNAHAVAMAALMEGDAMSEAATPGGPTVRTDAGVKPAASRTSVAGAAASSAGPKAADAGAATNRMGSKVRESSAGPERAGSNIRESVAGPEPAGPTVRESSAGAEPAGSKVRESSAGPEPADSNTPEAAATEPKGTAAHPRASTAVGGVGALRAQLREVARVFSSPLGRSVTLMIAAAEQETELSKAFRNHFMLARRNEGRAFLINAMASGELRKDLDVEVALDLIYAPVFYRLLLGHAPLTASFMDEVLDLALHGLAASPFPTGAA